MSKWKSETTNLESKEQLKSHRKDMWRGLLLQNGLDIDLIPFWTQAEKDIEQNLWAQADVDYENRKAILKEQLKALSGDDLKIYFSEIGIAEQDVDTWL